MKDIEALVSLDAQLKIESMAIISKLAQDFKNKAGILDVDTPNIDRRIDDKEKYLGVMFSPEIRLFLKERLATLIMNEDFNPKVVDYITIFLQKNGGKITHLYMSKNIENLIGFTREDVENPLAFQRIMGANQITHHRQKREYIPTELARAEAREEGVPNMNQAGYVAFTKNGRVVFVSDNITTTEFPIEKSRLCVSCGTLTDETGVFGYGNSIEARYVHVNSQLEKAKKALGNIRSQVNQTRSSLDNVSDELKIEKERAVALEEGIRAMKERISRLEEEKDKLAKMAMFDSLTGIRNRRAFDQDMHYAISQKEREPHNKMFLMTFDLDYFKDINDTFGHDIGDEVLKEFAKLIQSRSRSVDKIYRNGGEEFAMIFEARTKSGAEIFANELRVLIKQELKKAIPDRPNPNYRVTVSIGLTEIDLNKYPGVSSSEISTSIQKKADRALYDAKERGRNRVVTTFKRFPSRYKY